MDPNPSFPEPQTATRETTDEERQELEWLLMSGVLGRSGNLSRVLRYVCEEHFAGRGQSIKEYTIATEALGRRTDFDPNTDTIVRVTVHSLRKRLLDVYGKDGAGRAVRLVLPPGHYDPCFIRTPVLESQAEEPPPAEIAHEELPPQEVAVPTQQAPRPRTWIAFAVALATCVLSFAGWRWHHLHASSVAASAVHSSAKRPARPSPQATIRALMGTGRQPYTDHAGMSWDTGGYCEGGENINVSPQKISGTEDAPLYLGGVRGIAHCVFPVTQKLYELHFHFAETSDLPAATRSVSLSVNAGPSLNFDVVDSAGGDGIATSTVVTGVAPENDGAIHIDITSEVSLLSAVEILPAPSTELLPVRIVANSKPYVDSAGQFWTSDRYFSGGRHGLPPESVKQGNFGLYESDRVGRFRYSIPVVPSALYKVKLYFREPWFGKENGGLGGAGSRVFDVACNGQTLMKNFDILSADGSSRVIRTFDHVQASADGRIELSFLPIKNYAVINAIEVLPEEKH